MKTNKLLLATKILAVIIVCLIAFAGVYVQKLNKMENVLKEFNLSKDLKGYREIILKLSDANKVLDSSKNVIGDTDTYDDDTIKSNEYTKSEEKVNNQDSLTEENYETTKKIMEKRLKALGVEDYNISLDKETGTIYIQIPEDSKTDRIVSNIPEIGSVELKDSEDGTVLLSNDNLKEVTTGYNTETNGTVVYLSLLFNKDGTNKLKDLSENDYKTVENNTAEESSTEESSAEEKSDENKSEDSSKEEAKQKQVSLYISDSKVTTTSFDEPVTNGRIDLSLGQATKDGEEITDELERGSTIAAVINNGKLPLKYNVEENQYVSTDIKTDTIKGVIIAISIIIAILLVYMVIKFKFKGLLAVLSYIAFVALYTLLLRYTNVIIALEGIVAAVIVVVINYLFNMKLLSINDKKTYNKEYTKMLMKLLPIFAISIIFCFMKTTVLTSFGMVMFWGILLIALYNILVTKNIVE